MEISSAAKVGMISLLALIIVGLIFTQIGDWKNREVGYEINIIFDQIAGLQPQARVSLSGVRIGKVKRITILPNHKVKVTALITYKDLFIDKNSIFSVVGSLWGEKWIEIYPKPQGETDLKQPAPASVPLKPGDEVAGQPPVSIEKMLVEGHQALVQFRELVGQINKLVGDPKTQQDFSGTLANFHEVSKNVKTMSETLNKRVSMVSGDIEAMVAELRGTLNRVGTDLSAFSGTARRVVVTNEDDIRTVVKNLKSVSHDLSIAVEAVKNVVAKKEFNEDISATLANIKSASENIAGIASDIRIITSDPQIREDLKSTIHEAKQTAHQANVMFSNVNEIIGGNGDKKNKVFKLDVESEWNKATGQAVPNVNLRLFPYNKVNFKIGADSIGHNTVLNLQAGTNYKNFIFPRLGVIRSNLGIGVDGKAGNIFGVSLDAYDTQNTKVDAIGRINLGSGFYLLGGQRNMFNKDLKTTIYGVGASF